MIALKLRIYGNWLIVINDDDELYVCTLFIRITYKIYELGFGKPFFCVCSWWFQLSVEFRWNIKKNQISFVLNSNQTIRLIQYVAFNSMIIIIMNIHLFVSLFYHSTKQITEVMHIYNIHILTIESHWNNIQCLALSTAKATFAYDRKLFLSPDSLHILYVYTILNQKGHFFTVPLPMYVFFLILIYLANEKLTIDFVLCSCWSLLL